MHHARLRVPSAEFTQPLGTTLLQALRRNFTPFLIWWPQVTKETLRADGLAGFTGAVVVLPQGIAFAAIAGMPPEYGLYAAMVPAILAALFGSSPQLVSGPTTAASIVVFSSLSALAVPGTEDYVRFALTLTFMVGFIQLALGLARLGLLEWGAQTLQGSILQAKTPCFSMLFVTLMRLLVTAFKVDETL